jgi:hypothetical protein
MPAIGWLMASHKRNGKGFSAALNKEDNRAKLDKVYMRPVPEKTRHTSYKAAGGALLALATVQIR